MGKSALIGGETAEMPGFYGDGEYDMAGFSVGIVDKEDIITGESISAGDVIIGIPSSGIHSNGYSLVRKIVFEKAGLYIDDYKEELGETVGEALLRPTRIYANACSAVLPKYPVKGIVHITGGGFYENVPRILPDDVAAEFAANAWEKPPIFGFLQQLGNIDTKEMFSTFNMGIGMMMVVEEQHAEGVLQALADAGEKAYRIGAIIPKEQEQVIVK